MTVNYAKSSDNSKLCATVTAIPKDFVLVAVVAQEGEGPTRIIVNL